MGRKSNLQKFTMISAGDMSTASLTSPVTNIEFLDNIGMQLVFTGSPVGTFDVQVSIDYNPQTPSSATWTSMTLDPAPAAAGSASNIYIDMNQLSAPWIRLVYTKSSGTGALNAYLCGKMT